MNPPPLPAPNVPSPCIKVCMLDAQSVCVGCGRELSEIARWSQLSAAQQLEVCRRAEQRLLLLRRA